MRQYPQASNMRAAANLSMQTLVQLEFGVIAPTGVLCPGVEVTLFESLDEILADYGSRAG